VKPLALVLLLGLLIRAALLPQTYGGDFGMWSITAAATLRGQDTYLHTVLPIARAGPYAYFPLYLYILLPLKWLALHTGLAGLRLGTLPVVAWAAGGVDRTMARGTNPAYVVLGKLPVVVGDVVVALSLAGALRRAGLGERARALGAALFFLNPLVLYNGAFYGRFDSLCLAALMLAWRRLERPAPSGGGVALALWYGLAVTLKTFPVFLLPYLFVRAGPRRGLLAALSAVALPALVSLPYLLDNACRFIYIVFLYDTAKGPRQFSWQLALPRLLDAHAIKTVGDVLLALFALALIAFIPAAPGEEERSRGASPASAPAVETSLFPTLGERGRRLARGARDRSEARRGSGVRDPYTYAAVAYALFLLLSKVVYEQYFLWPLPFLIVLTVRDRARVAALLLAVLSVAGPLANGWIHPSGYRPGPALWLSALIASVLVAFALSVLTRSRRAARLPRSEAIPSTMA